MSSQSVLDTLSNQTERLKKEGQIGSSFFIDISHLKCYVSNQEKNNYVTLNLIFMNREYITKRELLNGATAFLVMEDRDETVSVYAKFPTAPANDIIHEHFHVAQVPENLINEIEERPTWECHTSSRLQEFIDTLWLLVQEIDPWYEYA